jgi:hypothetical protein
MICNQFKVVYVSSVAAYLVTKYPDGNEATLAAADGTLLSSDDDGVPVKKRQKSKLSHASNHDNQNKDRGPNGTARQALYMVTSRDYDVMKPGITSLPKKELEGRYHPYYHQTFSKPEFPTVYYELGVYTAEEGKVCEKIVIKLFRYLQ